MTFNPYMRWAWHGGLVYMYMMPSNGSQVLLESFKFQFSKHPPRVDPGGTWIHPPPSSPSRESEHGRHLQAIEL